MSLRRTLVLVVVALLAWPPPTVAQEGLQHASISGRVLDSSGAAVPRATVILRQRETNQFTTAETDREGRFRFPYVRMGVWEVTVSYEGFDPVTRVLTATAGAAFELPVTLGIEGVVAAIEVTAGMPVLEAARSQIAGTISAREVAVLPLNGRNLLDLALLVPGVSPANVGGTQLFPETSAVPGVSLSVASQRNLSNNFIVARVPDTALGPIDVVVRTFDGTYKAQDALVRAPVLGDYDRARQLHE